MNNLSLLRKGMKNLTRLDRQKIVAEIYIQMPYIKKKRDTKRFLKLIRVFTRLTLDEFLVRYCEICGVPTNEIHHDIARFPPMAHDIRRLCHKHNVAQGRSEIIWNDGLS